MKLVILGIQGSGKGTQSELIAKKYHLKRICIGEILRKEIRRNSKEGKILAKYLDKGLMAPNKIVNKLILKSTPKNNFIIDGFPRDKEQLKEADKINIEKVIFLKLPKKEVYRRIKIRRKLENRTDDEKKALKMRLNLFYKESPYIIKYFKKRVIRINGNQSVKAVFKNIIKALKS